jgi:hypothetical protein
MSEDEYNRLLKQFPEKLHGVLNWKTYFERLVQSGRRTGRTDIQIGDDIRKELKGQLDDSTVRHYLPPSFKHMEHASEHKEPLKIRGSPEPEYKPQIPPPSQEIQEAEVHIEPRQSQAQPEVNTDPILDCRRFGTELRMGLLNNSKLHLKINRLNEVVAID